MSGSEQYRSMLEKALNIHDLDAVSQQSYLDILEMLRESSPKELENHAIRGIIMVSGMLRGTASMNSKDAHTLLDQFQIPLTD